MFKKYFFVGVSVFFCLDFDTGVGKVNKLVNKKNKLFSFQFSIFNFCFRLFQNDLTRDHKYLCERP